MSAGCRRGPGAGCVLAGLLLLAGVAGAESWDVRLAHAFSGRLGEIESELEEIGERLPGYPAVPIDDQGGSGGFARLYQAADGEASMSVRWGEEATIDRVVLVPTRRYTAEGLEPQYGMPDGVAVELLDAGGLSLGVVGALEGLRGQPARAGHPVVIEVDPPRAAAGVRIRPRGMASDSDGGGDLVHAWAELFAFAGERNLALGAAVEAEGGRGLSAKWRWAPEFLVDGETPLGLPELPVEEHRSLGWISRGRESADEATWIELDLGEPVASDGLRLFPAKRPTSDLPSGFGFPRQLRVMRGDGGESEWVVFDLVNPGHNPVRLELPRATGRRVRLEASRLWKPYEGYPGFFALSEVEVLDGERNLARGARVRSPHGMGNLIASGGGVWEAGSLSDGFGPEGRIVPVREWLEQLDARLELETRRHRLREEEEAIVAGWRRAGGLGFGGLVALALCLIVALPIRYRVRERRQLREVRERIAGDLHDEVGSNLGSIQMLADLSEGRGGRSDELKRIQRIAAETVSAVRDIVWLLRPHGAHRIGTVEHLRETASIMLEPLEWEFAANEAAWQRELPDETNRHLFLFFREALHNVLRHSGAARAAVRVDCDERGLSLRIEDDGVGIPEAKRGRPATLRALRQRAEALGATLEVESGEGQGTVLVLRVPGG